MMARRCMLPLRMFPHVHRAKSGNCDVHGKHLLVHIASDCVRMKLGVVKMGLTIVQR
jgi:hypothetical protein